MISVADGAVWGELYGKTEKAHIPLIVVFELTHRCNLDCLHCYVPDKNKSGELSTEEVKNLISGLRSSGSLFITLTGGEIFVRDDIFEILEYIEKENFVLQIFTNATLITDEIAKRLTKFNVWEIGISLYGSVSYIHEQITMAAGSFDKTINGIENLVRHNLPVRIKCPLTKYNFKDYQNVIRLAKKLGVKYAFDVTISPKLNGDIEPLSLRIDKSMLEEIFMDKEIYPTFFSDTTYDKKEIILCQAGRNTVGISYSGDVYSCLQMPISAGNIRESSFKEIWDNSEILKHLRIMDEKDVICNSCNMVFSCPRCPGLAYLEDRNLYGKSKVCCEIAAAREKIKQS